MKSPILLVATGFLASAASAQESAPKRTPVGPPILSRLASPARIRGRVHLGEWGKPATGGVLQVLGQGLYGIEPLPPGTEIFDLAVDGDGGRFAWEISQAGHDPVHGILDLRPSRVVDLGEILLRRGSGVLEGRVTDVGGLPVAKAVVRVNGPLIPLSPGGEKSPSTKTDGTGRFRIEGIPEGLGYVAVEAPGLPAIAAHPLAMKAGGLHWLELTPVVGTVGLFVQCTRGDWDRPLRLTLMEEGRRLRVEEWISPSMKVERFERIRRGGSSCVAGSLGKVHLTRARDWDAVPWEGPRPEIRHSLTRTDVEPFHDRPGALLRNVPAGTWQVLVDGEAAEPPLVEVLPGGYTPLEVRLR